MNRSDILSDEKKNKIKTNLAIAMKKYINENNMTQEAFASLCIKKGYRITQGTVSNLINEKATLNLDMIVALCSTLEIQIDDIIYRDFSHIGEFERQCNRLTDNMLISTPQNHMVQACIGTYYCYFYPTDIRKIRDDEEYQLVRGILSISPDTDEKSTNVSLKIEVGDNEKKIYRGKFYISLGMNSCYCLILNEAVADLCLIVFNKITSARKLQAVMALAVTSASDSNHNPITHRFFMTEKKELTNHEIEYIKSHLYLNFSKIRICKNILDDLATNSKIDMKIVKAIKEEAESMEILEISESVIKNSRRFNELSHKDKDKLIAILHLNDLSNHYDKIGGTTNEAIYNYFYRK